MYSNNSWVPEAVYNPNGCMAPPLTNSAMTMTSSSGAPVAPSDAAGGMLALIVPGFPLVTTLQQIDAARWTCSLGAVPPSFVVFLTGAVPLPAGCGVGVYVSLQNQSEAGYQYIGCLRSERPSGLFSVPLSMLSQEAPNENATGACAMLGLAVESLDHLNSLGDAPVEAQQRTTSTRIAFAERIVEDFYSFAASYAKLLKSYFFAPSQAGFLTPEMLQDRDAFLSSIEAAGEEEFVVMPISFVNKWRERVMRRVQKDRTFIAS